MIARISTELASSPETVWGLLKRRETLLYVTRGLLGLPGAKTWPAEWTEGSVVRGRLWLFHVIPASMHEIRVVTIDDRRREMVTNERGGIIRAWNHRLTVEPAKDGRSRYTDEIHIDAGGLTLPVWIVAHIFYRYRQARWRGLARVLA